MNPHPPVDPRPEDVDPTGVRALLQSAPDPGPMPDDVFARITASLEHEQAARAGVGLSAELGLGDVSPLVARRRVTHRSWLAMGSAVAGIAAVTVVGTIVLHERTERSTSLGAAVSGGQSPLTRSAPVTTSQLRIQVSSTNYTAATLVEQARALLQGNSAKPAPAAPPDPDAGPLATPAGLDSCLGALGESDAQVVTADIARFEGQPAAILVVTRDGTNRVYAVQRQCSKGDPTIIEDAIPIG